MLFGGLRKCAIQSSFSQALDFKKSGERGGEGNALCRLEMIEDNLRVGAHGPDRQRGGQLGHDDSGRF